MLTADSEVEIPRIQLKFITRLYINTQKDFLLQPSHMKGELNYRNNMEERKKLYGKK
jgi:hypothetical protein